MSEVHTLNIDDVRVDPGTQMRANGLDDAVVQEYAAAIESNPLALPPVVVYYDGEHYWLASGHHRIAAHRRFGSNRIKAEVRAGSFSDAVVFALGCNAKHGLRRTTEDKRKAIITAIEVLGHEQATVRVVARHTNIDRRVTTRIMDSLDPPSEAPQQPQPQPDSEPSEEPTGAEAAPTEDDADFEGEDEPEAAVGDQDMAVPVSRSSVVRDAVGVPIPEHYTEVRRAFITVTGAADEVHSTANGLQRQATSLRQSVERMLETIERRIRDGSLPMVSSVAMENSRNAIAYLKHGGASLKSVAASIGADSRPHALCPMCGGEGCATCSQRAWLTANEWYGLSEEIKASHLEAHADGDDE